MDTLIIVLSPIVLVLFRKKPGSNAGFVLFWVAWLTTVLLFKYHVTSALPRNF